MTGLYNKAAGPAAPSAASWASSWATIAALTYALLRVGAGLLFMEHGMQKLFGLFGAHGHVHLATLMGLAGMLEFGGGLLIVLGLLTRPVALLLFGEMLVAYS